MALTVTVSSAVPPIDLKRAACIESMLAPTPEVASSAMVNVTRVWKLGSGEAVVDLHMDKPRKLLQADPDGGGVGAGGGVAVGGGVGVGSAGPPLSPQAVSAKKARDTSSNGQALRKHLEKPLILINRNFLLTNRRRF